MYEFNYQAPTSLADATQAIAGAEDGKLLAGGMTLVPTLKQRLARPSDLIDLSRIPDLKGIKVDGGTVTIGAMATHAEVGASEAVKQAIPGLAWLAGNIGDPAVRHRGTLGGSISNNDPAADYPAALLALGATIYTTKRQLSAADFFVGMFETALELDEIVTAVSFPIPEKSGYQKFRNPASRYAVVGVFVAKTGAGVRVAVTGAGPAVFRVPAFEAALDKSFTASALNGLSVPADELNADIHASAEYRAHLVTVFAKRAIEAIG
ncbi:MAG TPA: xanthine dehydrogenase family protein subunit M [Aliidongia sp.]|uniref:FAD binding domain-containing protein n=1 Tax=Aliidongia sp. TaxID=1914230 RepID=UPI002DDD374B|nr:xanthine dehydrogenase family protein subunit M [Aliidongia sp.]HEV2676946.1 xanthine dehydrogenase family protein subunit M [Aliidongia sp.]